MINVHITVTYTYKTHDRDFAFLVTKNLQQLDPLSVMRDGHTRADEIVLVLRPECAASAGTKRSITLRRRHLPHLAHSVVMRRADEHSGFTSNEVWKQATNPNLLHSAEALSESF